MNTPIEKLIEHFSNASNAAHELRSVAIEMYGESAPKFDRQMIHNWVTRGFIPWSHGELVEKATSGKITAFEICQAAAAKRHA